MSILSHLTVLPGTLEERQEFFRKAKAEILDEVQDPLLILRQIKSAAKLFESLLKDKDIDDMFLGEAEQYGKTFEHLGVKFNIQETGTKFDYKATGDPRWEDLTNQIAELTVKRQDREKALKFLPDEGVFDNDTGVLIIRAPKSSKTSVVVTV